MLNPYYKNDQVTLYSGDCLEILPSLEDGSIAGIITDLPYGTTANKWDIIIPFDELWRQVKRLLKPRGVFVTTASQPFTSLLICSNLEWFKYEWIWRKNRGGDIFNVKNEPLKLHEEILVFSQNGHTYNPQGLINTKKKRTARKGGSIFYADRDKPAYIQEFGNYPIADLYFPITDSDHPTQKPVALYEYLIRTYTNEGETVLDLSMGSGTTIVAAMQTKRRAIAIEKELKYCSIAKERVLSSRIPLFA